MFKKFLAPLFVLAMAGSSFAAETITEITSEAGDLLDAIYPIVIGAVAFGVLISLVKLVRRH